MMRKLMVKKKIGTFDLTSKKIWEIDLNLETAVGREKAVQGIYVHREL